MTSSIPSDDARRRRAADAAGAMSVSTSRRAVLASGAMGLAALTLPRMVLARTSDTILRFALSTFPPNISPWENTGTASGAIKIATMRGLTGYDGEGKLVGELAESWTQVDDLTLEFTLRANAMFHDGSPVTTRDVAFTLDSIRADDSTAYLKADLSIVTDIEIMDDKKFRLTLSEPSATLLNVLADFNCPIMSAESTAEAPIGAGPFMLKASERGVSIQVEAFEDFYEKGKPNVAGVSFVVYADENLRYAALEAGDVDLIEYVPWQSFDAAGANSDLRLKTSVGPFMFLLFNVSEGPFADPRVRQAVGYGIQRQDVIDAAFAGRGEPLAGFPNPPGSPFDTSDPAREWSFDPERAKDLLAEAGYPDGFSCRLLSTSTYGMHQDTASIVQAYLQMIGIDAELVLSDWATRVAAGVGGDYDIAVLGSAGNFNDPDSLFALLHSGEPSLVQSHGFESERINTLLKQGRAELNADARAKIYDELAQAYFEEVPQVPLNWRQQAYAMRASVEGFNNLPGFLTFSSPYCLENVTVT